MSLETISTQPIFDQAGEIDTHRQLATFGVRDVVYGKQASSAVDGGWLTRVHYLMQDCTVIEVDHLEPNTRMTDTSFWQLPAFATGIPGHNRRTALKLLAAGIPVAQVGPPNASTDHSMHRLLPEHPRSLNLTRLAHHVHQVAATALTETVSYPFFYQPDQIIVGGESHGGMVALVMKHIEDEVGVGHAIGHIKAIAPVFPKGLSLHDIPVDVLQVARNPVTAVQECLELSPRAVWDLLHTYPIGLSYLKTSLKMLPSLLGGEVGQAASQIPHDADMHIREFVRDDWCKGSVWKQFYAKHPRVVVDEHKGSHLSIVNDGLGSDESINEIYAALDRLTKSAA